MNSFYPALTPELSRTDLRNGGVLHASTQAEPRSGLGLNELLGLSPLAILWIEQGHVLGLSKLACVLQSYKYGLLGILPIRN